jgi:hypothetical protein
MNADWGWAYPPGMTAKDWKHIDGDDVRECPQCGSDVDDDLQWDAECHQCGTVLATIDDGPDPDDINDRLREEKWAEEREK